MINKIELHDFKNVKEFNTELKSINILIGENNSGRVVYCREFIFHLWQK